VASRQHEFTVTGPAEERTSPERGPALSLAITLASRLQSEGTYYVRDRENVGHYRVERHEDKSLTIHESGVTR
jgi:hypothetical protein